MTEPVAVHKRPVGELPGGDLAGWRLFKESADLSSKFSLSLMMLTQATSDLITKQNTNATSAENCKNILSNQTQSR